MKLRLIFPLAIIAVLADWTSGAGAQPPGAAAKSHLVCYYDSSAAIKEGYGKLNIDLLEPAVQHCDYLIYGYAGLNNNIVDSLNRGLDLDEGKGLYRTVTRLKRRYPQLRVLLSVGGDKDLPVTEEEQKAPNKYLAFLENVQLRQRFVDQLHALVDNYQFDGVDIAWQFNKNKPKKVHGMVGGFFKAIKKTFTGDHEIDERASEHKEQFTALLRAVKDKFRASKLLLSTTVLPNVNSSKFYDVPAVTSYVDFVNLAAFDFATPARNPQEADLIAPIEAQPERNAEFNVDYQVRYWTSNGCPSRMLNLGVATYARVWKLTDKPKNNGAPPVAEVADEAPIGEEEQPRGLYSWAETCTLLKQQGKLKLTEFSNPERYGNYAYRAPDKNGENGLWLSYENANSAAAKAAYVRRHNLGGIALYDLAYDDFRARCGEKYELLRAIKYGLEH